MGTDPTHVKVTKNTNTQKELKMDTTGVAVSNTEEAVTFTANLSQKQHFSDWLHKEAKLFQWGTNPNKTEHTMLGPKRNYFPLTLEATSLINMCTTPQQ